MRDLTTCCAGLDGDWLIHMQAYMTATSSRPEITAGERHTWIPRYLASRDSQIYTISVLDKQQFVGPSGRIVKQCLQPALVKSPTTKEEWKGISQQYSQLWNFPNCIGAIDGIHIVIEGPQIVVPPAITPILLCSYTSCGCTL